MASDYEALTEKEKATLRLILHGHDAKSIARHFSLSVHTVNDRLRDARRKLAVSSSREAARLLHAREAATPEFDGPKAIGVAASAAVAEPAVSPTPGDGRTHDPAPLLAGAALMSLFLGLLAFAVLSPPTEAPSDVPPATVTDAAVETSARAWLVLLDQGRWDESYAATATAFRALNTSAAWAAASERARAPLGAMRSRTLLSQEFLPAPPHGYEVVKFRTDFANKALAIETVTLDREGDSWRVVGITVG